MGAAAPGGPAHGAVAGKALHHTWRGGGKGGGGG